MDRLKALEVFKRVVELGGFAATARDLGISPAMVGNHVRALEAHFGAALLTRTTRQQTLTDEGAAVYERAVTLVAEMAALDEAARRKSGLDGKIRISAPLGIGRHFVAPVLRKLAFEHDALQIELRLSDQREDMVKSRLDLAVRNGPLRGSDSGLVARAVGRQELLLAAAPAYLARMGRPVSLNALLGHRTVRYSRDGRPRGWMFPVEGGLIQIDPPTAFMADDIETLLDATKDGLGVVLLPDWQLAPHFADGSLVRLVAEQPGLTVQTYLVRPNATPTVRVQAVSAALSTGLKQNLQ